MGNLDMIENRESIVPTNTDFELLPPGVYVAEVTNSELAPTSKGDGVILKLTHTLVDNNRKVWTNLNIQNPNEKAQSIALGMLSSLSRACGLPGIPGDSTDLHNIVHQVKIAVKTSKGLDANGQLWAPKNEIVAFLGNDGKQVKKAANGPAHGTVADDKPAFIDNELPDFMR